MIREKVFRNGFEYRLLDSGKKSLIYIQLEKGSQVGFEVHKLRYWKKRHIKGKYISSCNRWPTNEEFGKRAWSFRSLQNALAKFNVLENRQSTKSPSD